MPLESISEGANPMAVQGWEGKAKFQFRSKFNAEFNIVLPKSGQSP